MILEEDYKIPFPPLHSDVRQGFVLNFKERPDVDLHELEKKVLAIIAKDIPISPCGDNTISIGDRTVPCTGTRTHVHSSGKIENFRLIKEYRYDQISKEYYVIGLVGQEGRGRLRGPHRRRRDLRMNLIDPGPDKARYRRIDVRGVGRTVCGGRPALRVADGALKALAGEAFTDLAFYLRPDFLAAMRRILDDPEASDNDRFVAGAVLRNAVIAAEGVLPLCQDTGSIQIFAFRGHRVVTDGRDEEVLAAAASEVYKTRNLRYSIMAPLSVMDEVNTGTNLPAQIDLQAAAGREYRFFFMAKGGGSSNKIALFQESKARLEDGALESFLAEKIRALGVAACPPYRIAVVVGGLSPEMTLKTVKLASAGFLISSSCPKPNGLSATPRPCC